MRSSNFDLRPVDSFLLPSPKAATRRGAAKEMPLAVARAGATADTYLLSVLAVLAAAVPITALVAVIARLV